MLRRSAAEARAEDPARLGRNPLPGLAPPAREPERAPVVSLHQGGADSDREIQPPPPGAVPSGPGWRGVPEGVAVGDPTAVAGWLRALGPMSHAGLFPGSTYVARFTEHAGIVPPGAATDPTCSPGRALEVLDPAAWQALVGDLTGHLPRKDFPRKYTARALAQRWEQALGRLADEAQARRDRWRERGLA